MIAVDQGVSKFKGKNLDKVTIEEDEEIQILPEDEIDDDILEQEENEKTVDETNGNTNDESQGMHSQTTCKPERLAHGRDSPEPTREKSKDHIKNLSLDLSEDEDSPSAQTSPKKSRLNKRPSTTPISDLQLSENEETFKHTSPKKSRMYKRSPSQSQILP